MLALLQRFVLAMPMQGLNTVSNLVRIGEDVGDLRRTVHSCRILSGSFQRHRVLADARAATFSRPLLLASIS